MRTSPARPYFVLFLFLILPVAVVFYNCSTNKQVVYYKTVEQKPAQLFTDSTLPLYQLDYDIYIFSKGKIFKTTEFHPQGDSLIFHTYQLDSVETLKIKRKPIEKRTRHIEIYVNDSLAQKDTLAGEIAIQKEDVIVVRRYRAERSGSSGSAGVSSDSKIFMGSLAFVLLVLAGLAFLIYKLVFDIYNSCFIATLVYKSYDAPQVLTLRKYRDDYLLKTFHGKLFVAWYYSWSPLFVKIFANAPGMHKLIRFFLDKLVRRLEARANKKDLITG